MPTPTKVPAPGALLLYKMETIEDYPGVVAEGFIRMKADSPADSWKVGLREDPMEARYFSHTLLNLPEVIDARRDNQEWLDMVTALTMCGRPPVPHWMLPPPPQQTVKEAFFDPEPGCDPDPCASSSADIVNPVEEE